MKFIKRFVMLPALLAAALLTAPTMHAQRGMQLNDEACRQGQSSPIVGIWTGNLDFATLGKATVLISINQGGTFTETDSVDLNGTVGTASPGYAAWKAVDCRHYILTIHKSIFKDGQFATVILPGTIVLSEDLKSFTVNLKQQTYNQDGVFVPNFSGPVSGTATRVIPTAE